MGAACAAPATPGWEAAVRKADASYWDAYSRRDPAAINAFLADDVEFYHDRGGTLMGKAELGKANDGMKTSKAHLRRVLVPGTLHVWTSSAAWQPASSATWSSPSTPNCCWALSTLPEASVALATLLFRFP